MNLTGYTEVFTVVIGSEDWVYTESSGLTVTPLTGTISLVAPASDTEDWLADGRWSLVVTSGGGIVTTLAEGRLVRR